MGDFLGLREAFRPMEGAMKLTELAALAQVITALSASSSLEHKNTASMLCAQLNLRARAEVLGFKPEKEVTK